MTDKGTLAYAGRLLWPPWRMFTQAWFILSTIVTGVPPIITAIDKDWGRWFDASIGTSRWWTWVPLACVLFYSVLDRARTEHVRVEEKWRSAVAQRTESRKAQVIQAATLGRQIADLAPKRNVSEPYVVERETVREYLQAIERLFKAAGSTASGWEPDGWGTSVDELRRDLRETLERSNWPAFVMNAMQFPPTNPARETPPKWPSHQVRNFNLLANMEAGLKEVDEFLLREAERLRNR